MTSPLSAEKRLEIASRILAGFAANSAIYAPEPQCGWRLVNCKQSELAGEAMALANELLIASQEWERNAR